MQCCPMLSIKSTLLVALILFFSGCAVAADSESSDKPIPPAPGIFDVFFASPTYNALSGIVNSLLNRKVDKDKFALETSKAQAEREEKSLAFLFRVLTEIVGPVLMWFKPDPMSTGTQLGCVGALIAAAASFLVPGPLYSVMC
jgi:hypothetical protein